jgi:hypothetical protein
VRAERVKVCHLPVVHLATIVRKMDLFGLRERASPKPMRIVLHGYEFAVAPRNFNVLLDSDREAFAFAAILPSLSKPYFIAVSSD